MVLSKAQILGFEKLEKTRWLERLRGELKGKEESTLDWEIEEGITLKPYYTPADRHSLTMLEPGWLSPGWQKIAIPDKEDRSSTLPEKIKREIDGGMDTMLLTTPLPEDTKVYDLLEQENIFILQIKSDRDSRLINNLSESGAAKVRLRYETADLNGFSTAPKERNVEYACIVNQTSESMHSTQFSKWLNHLMQCMDHIENRSEIDQVVFVFNLELDFIKNVLYLRAWHKLMAAFFAHYPDVSARPKVECHVVTKDETDPFRQMVLASMVSASAISGGTDSLCIHPISSIEGTEPYTSARISRNIHHILEKESYFDRQEDLVLGSYYFEMGSELLAKKVWENFMV